LYLSKIEIQNFRSIKDLTINLQQGLNVFVGRNNVGKTTIMHAIRHALGPSSSQGDTIWLDKDDFYKEASSVDRTESISITLTFEGLSEEQRTTFYEICEFDLADMAKTKAIIRFNASMPQKKKLSTRRTGGPLAPDMSEVPQKILESIPITFLPALRDAEAALAPGYKNRLALLLKEKIERDPTKPNDRIVHIYTDANDQLKADPLIAEVVNKINDITKEISGVDYKSSDISVAEADLSKILRTLQVLMNAEPISSLRMNGLGLNNLLYISVVLQHLEAISNDECPLLLVEEPEAHLHPQLTVLLSSYLSNKLPGDKVPQTLVTTHSPILVTSVPISKMHILFHNDSQVQCSSLSTASLSEPENRQLQRMMDITRSTLYFARGAILVEGISECLLLPTLARRLGHDLENLQISIIPICGVSFGIFDKVLKPQALGIPVAIISDSDPEVIRTKDATWESDMPTTKADGTLQISDRTQKLISTFSSRDCAIVKVSELTLEYDLAKAGNNNALVMAEAWEACFDGTPRTFSKSKLASLTTKEEKALAAWRGICRADNTGSKADLAHNLTALLLEMKDDKSGWKYDFSVPDYIKQAIEFVVQKLTPAVQ
jgi:putative ATP-dependent endonuclease of the OLD family